MDKQIVIFIKLNITQQFKKESTPCNYMEGISKMLSEKKQKRILTELLHLYEVQGQKNP